jgi:hypothetical protein
MRWNHLHVEADPALIGRKLLYLKVLEHPYLRRIARESGSTKADDALGERLMALLSSIGTEQPSSDELRVVAV